MKLVLVTLLVMSASALAETQAEPADQTQAGSSDAIYVCGGDCNRNTNQRRPTESVKGHTLETIEEILKIRGTVTPEELDKSKATKDGTESI